MNDHHVEKLLETSRTLGQVYEIRKRQGAPHAELDDLTRRRQLVARQALEVQREGEAEAFQKREAGVDRVYGLVKKFAMARVEAGEVKTLEQGVALVLKQNPELYSMYDRARRGEIEFTAEATSVEKGVTVQKRAVFAQLELARKKQREGRALSMAELLELKRAAAAEPVEFKKAKQADERGEVKTVPAASINWNDVDAAWSNGLILMQDGTVVRSAGELPPAA